MNSNKPSRNAERILNEALEHLDKSDDPLEYHLPESVTSLDKAYILAVLYRVISTID
jgi:hypothetical protein